MKERDLRDLIADVKTGRLTRRAFVQRMIAVGLTAPMAGMMLSQSGVAMAATAFPYKPTKAGGGGPLKLLYWQAITLLNPHFAIGTKDQEGSRIFYEPLAGWDGEGNLVPFLAAEIPSKENDGLAEDGRSVVWKLKRGVKWHDGKPFTADDVVFTWEYARNPETAAVSIASYKDVTVEKIDDFSVRVVFAKPTPYWADAFVGTYGMILPKHLFGDYIGGKSRDAPANLKPVGTGAYMFVDFKPGDVVLARRNADYHVPNRPQFDTLEVKGGGDAVSAARAVLQTGEYDYAWNMQVEDEILLRLEAAGKGKVTITPSGNVEFIMLNVTDPWTEVDGERASIKTKHPLFSDPAVRQAINLLIDRASHRHRHGELPQQPGTLPVEKHQIRIPHRESQPGSRGRRVEEGRRRRSRQGRQAAEVRLPDLHQCAAAEDAGHHQAGLPEGRHRCRAEIGGGIGVLLVGHRQSRHLPAFLLRRADVQHHHAATRSAALHEPVRVMAGCE
jgi:peptide/nickel transport system substrate-binding protein